MDAPRMHSHETCPLHNIAQVLQHSGFYPKYGVCPKFVPQNVFSLHTLRGAEEYDERERFPECGAEDYCTAESETRRQWQSGFYLERVQFLRCGGLL